MNPKKTIILGVCGSISAYRAADLARELMRAGCDVHVCLTDAAQKFVTPILFETLTGNPCLTDTFIEPVPGRMAHIDLARKADLVVIAPGSANTISRLAQGVAEDMLTTLVLAYRGEVVIAPAMNPSMLANQATQASINTLIQRGVFFVDPIEGDVVAGETGPGKLAPVTDITQQVLAILATSDGLRGQRVLITSGPTQEAIDDIRFLSNRSSGKMGAALARAALLMGAEVTIVTGPTAVLMPIDARVIRVRSAEEMLFAAVHNLEGQDWVVGAAAVADYRPANPFKGKMRRSNERLTLDLVPNPDIIAELVRLSTAKQKVIGFAAEPDAGLETAKEKVVRKGLHAIVVNDVSRSDVGFEADSNEVTLVLNNGHGVKSGFKTKFGIALFLWEHLLQVQDFFQASPTE